MLHLVTRQPQCMLCNRNTDFVLDFNFWLGARPRAHMFVVALHCPVKSNILTWGGDTQENVEMGLHLHLILKDNIRMLKEQFTHK